MSTYICEKCGCIDNTACGGNYWAVVGKLNDFADEYSNTHVLCAECTPAEYADGTPTETRGKWHDMFPKTHWSKIGEKEIMQLYRKKQGNYVNAEKYFKEHGGENK